MLVGLVPMGGFAERWRPYPCPKELLPFGTDAAGRPRVIADVVIDRMIHAGIEQLVIPVRPEKATMVMSYYGHKLTNGADVVYIAAPGPSILANLQACVPLLRGHTVLFGFPDTYFEPLEAFSLCLKVFEPGVELVLGTFENHDIPRVFTTYRDGQKLVRVRTSPKPPEEREKEVWGVAVWGPDYTERMAAWNREDGDDPSYVHNAAAQAGNSRCIPMPDNAYYEDMASYTYYERFLCRQK
ncbi:MAG TPA: hypothetical protein VH186_11570 [Chloroflexia bacterium]|nr:hypothetical protein [Chloroflexia bacterium]